MASNKTVAEIARKQREFAVQVYGANYAPSTKVWKLADRFEAAHNRELSAEQKRCGEILRDQIAEVERAAEKVAAKDAEIAELRRRLKVAEDALDSAWMYADKLPHQWPLPERVRTKMKNALAAIREPVTDCNQPKGANDDK